MRTTQEQDNENTDKSEPQTNLRRGHWREEKMIRDAKTGRIYGPYLYERWRDGKICRSKYLGKVLS